MVWFITLGIALFMLGYAASFYYGNGRNKLISPSYLFATNSEKERFSAHELTPMFRSIFGKENCRDINQLERNVNKHLPKNTSCSANDALISSICLFAATVSLGYLFATFLIDNNMDNRFVVTVIVFLSCLIAFAKRVSDYFDAKNQVFLSEWKEVLFNYVKDDVLTSLLLKMDNNTEVMASIAKMRDARKSEFIFGADVLMGIVDYYETKKGNDRLDVEKMIQHYSASK